MLDTQLKPEVEGNRIIYSDGGEPFEYHVEKFGSKTTIDLLPHVMLIFSQGLGEIAEGMWNDADDKVDAAMTGKGLETLARRMIEVDFSSLCMRLLSSTSRKPKTFGVVGEFVLIDAAVFNVVYAGNLGEMLKALMLAVEVNYAPFLKDKLGGFEPLKQRFLHEFARLSTQGTPTSSTGESSEKVDSPTPKPSSKKSGRSRKSSTRTKSSTKKQK